MNKVQLQEKLQPFIQENESFGVELYLQYEDELGNINTYLPAAEENKLSSALEKMVRNQIKGLFFIENENFQYEVVSAHTAEANNIRQIFHVNAKKIPKAELIFDEVVKDTALDYPTNLELKDAWSYIYKVQCMEGTLFLWKRNYSLSTLRKENNYSIFFSNRKLSLFDKDLLRLSNHFDVMLIEKELIIINRTEFEKAFDYIDAMQATAEVNVDVITKTNLVSAEGMEKIAELSKNKTTLRKILNINPKSKILLKQPKQIVRLAKKYKIDFKMTTNEKQLSISTKKSAVAFVEMLNDDYLHSEFSGSLYKIKGKSPI